MSEHFRLIGFDRGFAPGSLPILANNTFLQGRNTPGGVPQNLIGVNAANKASIDPGGLGAVFGSTIASGPSPLVGGYISLDLTGSNLAPFLAKTNGTPGNYTLNSALLLYDQTNTEIMRVWGTDPNPASRNHGNLYVGAGAGLSQPTDNVTAGSQNTGIGFRALQGISTGSGNTGVGFNTLFNNTVGSNNTVMGLSPLPFSAGSNNVAIGAFAGLGALGNDVNNNTLVGYGAGFALLVGGDSNTLLGYQAGANIDVGANNIIIGAGVNADAPSGSNQLNIGNALKGNLATLDLQFSALARLQSYTVATLPVGAAGDLALVTDALAPAPLTPVVGLGAAVVPVYNDGAVWNVV